MKKAWILRLNSIDRWGLVRIRNISHETYLSQLMETGKNSPSCFVIHGGSDSKQVLITSWQLILGKLGYKW